MESRGKIIGKFASHSFIPSLEKIDILLRCVRILDILFIGPVSVRVCGRSKIADSFSFG